MMAQAVFRPGDGELQMADEGGTDGVEMEAAIEAPSGFCEIALGILGKVEGVVATIDCTFDIAEHGAHPGSAIDPARLASALGLDDRMRVTGFFKGAKAAQPVAVDLAIGR